MTLLFVEGFDHFALADLTKKWTATYNNSNLLSTTGGRRSTGGLKLNGNFSYVSKTFPSGYSEIFFGGAVQPTTETTGSVLFVLLEGTTAHLSVYFTAGGGLKVYRGVGTTLLGTGNTVLNTGTWYYVEIRAVIHDSTGIVKVRVNGVQDTGLDLSSIDTRNAGTSGVIDRVMLGYDSSGMRSAWWDDIYVCNASGSVNNTFLGDCRVDTLLPTGDGNYTNFTPSTGSTHYSLVDETAPNTTDYVSSSTNGHRDSFTFPDLTALSSQTIHGIQINAAALKSDSGTASMTTMTRLSSTDADGATVALGTSQTITSQIYETDPAAAAWTESNINSAEFGVKAVF